LGFISIKPWLVSEIGVTIDRLTINILTN